MTKVDLKAERKELYAPKAGVFVEVDVPPMSYLMVDGHGDPNSESAYTEAVEALFAVSYAVKFTSKRKLDRDYVVMPLEGLWWADDHTVFAAGSKSDWDWTMMLRQPDWVTDAMISEATDAVTGRKHLPGVPRLRFAVLDEGRSIQTLHLGGYDDEGPVLDELHSRYLPSRGLAETGKHHEIYLSDPRKTDTAKLRTILRQPVRALASEPREETP